MLELLRGIIKSSYSDITEDEINNTVKWYLCKDSNPALIFSANEFPDEHAVSEILNALEWVEVPLPTAPSSLLSIIWG